MPAIKGHSRRNWRMAWIVFILLLLAIPVDYLLRYRTLATDDFVERFKESRREFQRGLMIKEDTEWSREYTNFWRNSRLTWPAALHEGAPFAIETLDAAAAFNREWAKNDKAAIAAADSCFPTSGVLGLKNFLAAGDKALARKRLNELNPLLAAFEQMARRPDYTINAAAPPLNPDCKFIPPMTNNVAMQTCSRLLAVRSVLNLENPKSAWADANTILLAARPEPFGSVIEQLMAADLVNLACTCGALAAGSQKAPDQLKLQLVDTLTAGYQFRYNNWTSATLVNERVLGESRYYLRRGHPFDLNNKTGRDLFFFSYKMRADYLRDKVLPGVAGNPQLRRWAEHEIGESDDFLKLDSDDFYKSADPRDAKLAREAIDRILTAIPIPNGVSMLTRLRLSLVKIDLLKIHLAARLYEIGKGEPPEHFGELVPLMLESVPNNRYPSDTQSYRIKPMIRAIGPDLRDDLGRLLYDPTNGSASAGDVMLLPPDESNLR